MTRTIDQHKIAVPGTGAQFADGRASFRRILVPVRSPGESGPALAVAARICGMTNGLLHLVHVRTSDPPLRSPARFYRETPGEAAAVLEQAQLTAWAREGPRATTAVVDARRPDVASGRARKGEACSPKLLLQQSSLRHSRSASINTPRSV